MAGEMERYFVLAPRVAPGHVFIEDYDAPRAYDFDYAKGVPITAGEPAELRYTDPAATRPDLVSGVHLFPVVSARFRDVLADAGGADEVEYHPVRLVCTRTGETDLTYRMMNILGNVACLDRAASNFETLGDTPFITELRRLAVDLAPLQGRSIARMDEVRDIVLVSGVLRERMERAGITGVEFAAPEEYET
ncbi:MAG: hypothetical protein KY467_12195 [Gemmatimonadetes bacterium]|nr:hypothetical protein [Gemmatimonadota bacterium]